MRFDADGLGKRVPMGGVSEDEAEAAMMESYGGGDDDFSAKVVEIVKRDVDLGRRANESERDLRIKHYNAYRAKGDGKLDRPGRSRINCSDIMDAIEWMMPSFMKTFAGSYECVSVSPVGAEDVDKAEKLQKLLNWQFMSRHVGGFSVLYVWIKSSLIYGTSIVKVTWVDRYKKQGFDVPVASEDDVRRIMEDDDYVDVFASPEVVAPGTVISEDVMQLAAGSPAMLEKIGQMNAPGYGVQPVALEPFRIYRDVNGVKKIKTYSGPLVEVVSPEDFYIDPEAKSIDSAQFVVHRVWRSFGELKKLEEDGVYRNVDRVRSLVDRNRDGMYNAESSARYAAAGELDPAVNYTAGPEEQTARKKLEVFEWWGWLDPKGDGLQEHYLVVLCGDHVLRMEKNPYAHEQAPFEVLRPMLDPFKFTGVGMPELVGEFQEVKTAIMRQTLDNISYQNNGMWLVNRNAGVDMQALLHARPGGLVRTNIVQGAVQPITPSSLQSMPLNMMELMDSMLQKRTGVTSYNQGVDANSLNKTATGITKIMNASAQRIELIARIMAETGIRPLYQKLLSLNQQFVDQTIVVRVFNSPITISPDDLAGEFDVTVDVGGATNKDEMRAQQMMLLMQYAANLIQLGVMRPVNVYSICRKLMEIWGWKDYERYLSDPNEIEQLRTAMQIIEQLGAAVQGGTLPAPQVIYQAFKQIYDILNQVLGVSAQQEMGAQGTPSNESIEGAGGGVNGGEYSATTIPGRNANGGAVTTA